MNSSIIPTFSSNIIRDRFLENTSPQVVCSFFENFAANEDEISYEDPITTEFQKNLLSRQSRVKRYIKTSMLSWQHFWQN